MAEGKNANFYKNNIHCNSPRDYKGYVFGSGHRSYRKTRTRVWGSVALVGYIINIEPKGRKLRKRDSALFVFMELETGIWWENQAVEHSDISIKRCVGLDRIRHRIVDPKIAGSSPAHTVAA